eukprot:gene16130-19137_t
MVGDVVGSIVLGAGGSGGEGDGGGNGGGLGGGGGETTLTVPKTCDVGTPLPEVKSVVPLITVLPSENPHSVTTHVSLRHISALVKLQDSAGDPAGTLTELAVNVLIADDRPEKIMQVVLREPVQCI